MVAEWLSSWLAEQEVRDSIPRLATWISEIGYLLLPSRDMAEIPLKRRKSSIQPTNQPTNKSMQEYKILCYYVNIVWCTNVQYIMNLWICIILCKKKKNQTNCNGSYIDIYHANINYFQYFFLPL